MTKNLIDSLNLELKQQRHELNPIGEQVLKDAINLNPIASKEDVSNWLLLEYMRKLEEAINKGASKHKQDFYIEIYMRRDKIIKKGIRILPFIRLTPPIPFYNKDLYKYNYKTSNVSLLWSIPDRILCKKPYLIEPKESNIVVLDSIKKYNSGYFTNIYNEENAKCQMN